MAKRGEKCNAVIHICKIPSHMSPITTLFKNTRTVKSSQYLKAKQANQQLKWQPNVL